MKRLILTNARFLSAPFNGEPIESVIVDNGRVVFTGTFVDARAKAGAGSEVIDLEGATVLPGLMDAHGHVAGLGRWLLLPDLRRAQTRKEFLLELSSAAARTTTEWVEARGWGNFRWEGGLPTAEDLDQAVRDRPVVLRRQDGHAVCLNSKGIALSGIGREAVDPNGGKIIQDGKGRPTGVLMEEATQLVERFLRPSKIGEVKDAILRAQESCLSKGLVAVHDAGVDSMTIEAYEALGREGRLVLRFYLMADAHRLGLETVLDRGIRVGEFGGKLTLRAIKIFADGALGSRGAHLSEPYSDDPSCTGIQVTHPEQLEEWVRDAAAAGFQPVIHAIGDQAVRNAIDVFERCLPSAAAQALRPRIEHAQVVRPEDVLRMARCGIIASMQPVHWTEDRAWAVERLGTHRMPWAYAWRSMLNAGVPLAFGSDFPVETNSPMQGLQSALLREGDPEGVLTLEEALHAYTTGTAFSAFEELERGQIKVGYTADFTVLRGNLAETAPEELGRISTQMTIVGGNRVSCDA